MASGGKEARSTSCVNRSRFVATVCLVLFLLLLFCGLTTGGHHGHGNNSQMEKLLAAGLIAKALAKNGDEGGHHHGGGHQYMPIPIPMGSGGGAATHHHHVHHKYVPIPVKHHTNFIIAHHKVPVPVHIPVPVVKTKIVHVPLEKTKIVPIIVHKGHHHHQHSPPHSSHSAPYSSPSSFSSPFSSHSASFSDSSPRITIKKAAHTQASSASSGIAALASKEGTRHLRITTLGKVRKVKDKERNGADALQVSRPSSKVPDKWIVVVKNKRRPTTIRRLTTHDSMVADSKIIPRIAIANATAPDSAKGPR